MKIYGFQRVTLIDYPGKLAATVFLSGCNFRCPWCYSKELVLAEEIKKQPKILEKELFDFLKQRKEMLEGVVLCGGEPTFNNDLPKFCKEIKKMGYEYGSVEKKVFDVPSDIKKVCFAEHDNNAITQVMVGDAVIWDSIDSGVEKNVFLKKGSVAEESFYIGNIEVEGPPPAMNPFLCFDVASSKIIVRLEGLGKKVKVSEW